MALALNVFQPTEREIHSTRATRNLLATGSARCVCSELLAKQRFPQPQRDLELRSLDIYMYIHII